MHRGWRVAILDVLEAAGEELAKELRQSTLFIKCDVASYEQQANAFLKVKQTWGRIDALITNAGVVERSSQYIFRHRGSNELPPEPNTMAIDINFKALIYGIQLAIHFMRQNPTPGGQIVCVASLAGVYGTPIYPEYSGSKAAVSGKADSVVSGRRLTLGGFLSQVVSYTMAAAPVLQRVGYIYRPPCRVSSR